MVYLLDTKIFIQAPISVLAKWQIAFRLGVLDQIGYGVTVMKSVGSYEAKTHLPRLLSQVEKGETVTITKRGKPIARLVPVEDLPARDVSAVVEEMLRYRDQHGPVLGDELSIRGMIEEGRP